MLPSRDIGAAAIALPELKSVIKDPAFIRRHLKRFKGVDQTCVKILTAQLEQNNYRLENCQDDCVLYRTFSGHCANCLLLPHLLSEDVKVTECYCVDHRELWGLASLILWDTSYVFFDEIKPWPVCARRTRDSLWCYERLSPS